MDCETRRVGTRERSILPSVKRGSENDTTERGPSFNDEGKFTHTGRTKGTTETERQREGRGFFERDLINTRPVSVK